MPLKTRENGFGRNCPDPPLPSDPTCPECYPGQLEFCVKMCWADNCPADWDLWLRDRAESGGEAWASYLNLGPVGETRTELNNDIEKPSNNDFCNDPDPCGLLPTANGYAGEMACACLDGSMTFPKIFDVVTNFYGNDEFQCPLNLDTLCVQYFCNGDLILTSTIADTLSGTGMGDAGNYGLSPYRHPAARFDDAVCTSFSEAGTSECWVLSAERFDGSLFVNRGPGRAPSRFVIPDDARISTCILYEDGALVPRSYYQVMHQSVADKTEAEQALYGIRGVRTCSRQAISQPRRPCKKCKKPRPKNLF